MFRHLLGLSQSELSDFIGLSQPMIAKIESGFSPNSQVAKNICRVFNINENYLYRGELPIFSNKIIIFSLPICGNVKDSTIKKAKSAIKNDLKKFMQQYNVTSCFISEDKSVQAFIVDNSLIFFWGEAIYQDSFMIMKKELNIKDIEVSNTSRCNDKSILIESFIKIAEKQDQFIFDELAALKDYRSLKNAKNNNEKLDEKKNALKTIISLMKKNKIKIRDIILQLDNHKL